MAINDLDQRRTCNSEINKVNEEYVTNTCVISYMLFNCDFLKAGKKKTTTTTIKSSLTSNPFYFKIVLDKTTVASPVKLWFPPNGRLVTMACR